MESCKTILLPSARPLVHYKTQPQPTIGHQYIMETCKLLAFCLAAMSIGDAALLQSPPQLLALHNHRLLGSTRTVLPNYQLVVPYPGATSTTSTDHQEAVAHISASPSNSGAEGYPRHIVPDGRGHYVVVLTETSSSNELPSSLQNHINTYHLSQEQEHATENSRSIQYSPAELSLRQSTQKQTEENLQNAVAINALNNNLNDITNGLQLDNSLQRYPQHFGGNGLIISDARSHTESHHFNQTPYILQNPANRIQSQQQSYSLNFEGTGYGYGYSVHGEVDASTQQAGAQMPGPIDSFLATTTSRPNSF